MRVFAISDLHLSFMVEKPMDIFGGAWEDHTAKLKENWESLVLEDDLVLIAGDISWAMRLEETKKDFEFLHSLAGKKVIIRGNHEYWWKGISSVRAALPSSVVALQNDSARFDNILVAGTRGWESFEGNIEDNCSPEDRKIYEREVIRLSLALDDMEKKRTEGDKVFCMMHYPPFNARMEDSAFTRLFEEHNVDAVVFGHVHQNRGRYKLESEKNGVRYYLTSADLIEMKPCLIYE